MVKFYQLSLFEMYLHFLSKFDLGFELDYSFIHPVQKLYRKSYENSPIFHAPFAGSNCGFNLNDISSVVTHRDSMPDHNNARD